MNYHDLKILPEYFEQVRTGQKTFEIRKNDRDFQPGDTVALREYQQFSPTQGSYTGKSMHFTIGYVLPLEGFVDKAWVVFSLLPEREVGCVKCAKLGPLIELLKTEVAELADYKFKYESVSK